MKTPNLLVVKNLNLSISGISILKNISFKLKKNEILGFVGESGSGKSLTAFSIINLLNSKKIKKSGHIFFNGKRIDSLNNKSFEKIRGSEISIIFQEPMSCLNPSMKCGRQVLEIILKHQLLDNIKAKKRVLDLFQMVQLIGSKTVYNKYPHELSGGQQQRVMIAIAIACNPKILIADEPTTSLDGIVKKEILFLLKEIQNKTKMGIIFVSHDLNLVSKIANNIIVLKKGSIIEFGDAKSLFKSPKNIYTQILLNARPPKIGRPKRLPASNNNLKKLPLISKREREEKHKKIYRSEPLLKIKNLYFSYGKKLILNNINFNLYQGETLGLIGESGSGKSTIAKSILNLNNFQKGRIFFNNIDIKKYNQKEYRKNHWEKNYY